MIRVSLLFVILIATIGPAVADAHPEDSFGIYFDPQAVSYRANTEPFVPVDVYLILTHPLTPFDGFECTVTWSGAYLYLLSSALAAGGVDADLSANGFAVTAPTPYPVTGGVAVLATWQFLPVTNDYVGFYIGPATNPSLPGGLPAVSPGGVARLCPVSSCHVDSPVAEFNGLPPVAGGSCSDWGLNIYDGVTVSTAGLPSVRIHASTLSYATDGQDLALDFPTIATTGSPYLQASFEHQDWTGGPRFRKDVRAQFDLFQQYGVWPILVETDVAGTVTLQFSSNWIMDPPLLRDLQTGQVRYLWRSPSYSFTNDGLPRSYRFELYEGATRTVAGVADPAGAAGRLTASPNPFNPRTTLRFDLPQAGAARLAVYDLAGRLVRTLVDGSLPQGANEVAWDGRDETGRPVSTGAYVARLEAGEVLATTRLGLLR
jgi:hypothetical protein